MLQRFCGISLKKRKIKKERGFYFSSRQDFIDLVSVGNMLCHFSYSLIHYAEPLKHEIFQHLEEKKYIYKIKVVYFHCEVSLEGKECEEVIFKFGRDGTVKER